MSRSLWPILALALVSTAAAAEDLAFFEQKVRPLLIDKCYECHAEGKKIKGGLRLDTKEGWAKGGDTGPALVPGKPDESLLIEAVRYANRDLEMPPKNRLTPAEVQILEEWVRLGAPDPRTDSGASKNKKTAAADLWSFKPLAKAPPPEAKAATAIDRFLLAKLEEKKLGFSPPAEKAVLLRRLTYALTGLPPTPQEVDAFERDSSPGAFSKAVDLLLATPQFGERWGRHWLDVARFAESSGGGRTLPSRTPGATATTSSRPSISDVPFDRFIREQIAGDLLPHASREERRRQLDGHRFPRARPDQLRGAGQAAAPHGHHRRAARHAWARPSSA